MNRQPGLLVADRLDLVVELAADAVLRAEQRDERDAWRAREHVDRARAVARPSGLVREQADALAAQPREPLGGEHVDAGQDRLV